MSQSTMNKSSTPYEQFQNDHGPVPEYSTQDYATHQMNYMQPQTTVPQVVLHNPGNVQTFTVEASPVKWSWCNLITAVISMCCCQLFGIIATIMAILAYVDHKTKDFERSKNKRSVAYGFGIAAIVIGSVVIVGLIIFGIVMATAVTDQVHNMMNDNSYVSNNNNY